MKFYVETSQFQRLVDVACRFSAARSPDERFRIIRILVDAYGRVVVSSRSPAGESAKLHMQSVKFDEAGAFCVDSRLFQAAVKTVRGDKMAVEKTGNMCSVVFAGGTTKMPVSDAELTLSGEQPTTGELAVDTESFSKLAGRVNVVENASTGSCWIVTHDGKVLLVSADKWRGPVCVAFGRLAETEANFDAFLSGKSLMQCLAGCPGKETKLVFGGSSVRLVSETENEGVVFSVPLVIGEMMPLGRMMAMTGMDCIATGAEDFFAACKQLSVVKMAESVGADLEFREDEIRLSMQTASGESSAVVKSEGPAMASIRANVEHLCLFSRACTDETLWIGVGAKPGSTEADYLVLKNEQVTAISMGITRNA